MIVDLCSYISFHDDYPATQVEEKPRSHAARVGAPSRAITHYQFGLEWYANTSYHLTLDIARYMYDARAAPVRGVIPYSSESASNIVTRVFRIPGLNSKTSEHCGSIRHVYACEHHPGAKRIVHREWCGRRECEVCFGQWVSSGSKRIHDKLYMTEQTLREQKLFWGKIRHIVIVPPQQQQMTMASMSLQKIYDIFSDKAKRSAISGYMIFHPYRVKRELWGALDECMRWEVHTPRSRSLRRWELVRKDALCLGNWSHYVEWWPHCHVVAFAHRKRHESPGWSYDYKDVVQESNGYTLRGLLSYLLDHTCIQDLKTTASGKKLTAKAYRSFGQINNAKIDWSSSREATCDVCGLPLKRHQIKYGTTPCDEGSYVASGVAVPILGTVESLTCKTRYPLGVIFWRGRLKNGIKCTEIVGRPI